MFAYPTQQSWTDLPVYAPPGVRRMEIDGQSVVMHSVGVGESVIDYLMRLHRGGPIIADCVAYAYIVDACRHRGDLSQPFEFIVVFNPRVEALPEGAVHMGDPQHVIYEWKGSYYHMLPSGPVCSPSLHRAEMAALVEL